MSSMDYIIYYKLDLHNFLRQYYTSLLYYGLYIRRTYIIFLFRVAAHKHPFHDKKIIKKLQTGAVFTAIKDAEDKGKQTSNRKDAAIVYLTEDLPVI
jgi:hypothetical protein